MADLETTYQQSSIRVGEEVDYFASQLDRHHVDFEGSPAEQRARIFKLVDSYYTYTRSRADRLYDRLAREKSRGSQGYQRGDSADMDIDEVDQKAVDPEEFRRVEEEAQTWDLLRRMLPLRYRDQQPKKPEDSAPGSRQQWWDEFLVSDSLARERKVVLEWLQTSASHGPPIDEVVSELQQNAERGDILAHGWLHTRHKIKLQKSVNGYQGIIDPNDIVASRSHLGSETLITQLDPDAITRQSRKLEPQDEFFERAIWLGCFEMLRRGYTMEEIRDWCSVRTELWRAATIAPLPLSNPEDEEQLDFDPKSLILWRRMCFASARDGGTSDYDRAVYGLLAGDLESVQKVCKSWDDYLFTNYNAVLRSQFDNYLIKRAGDDTAAKIVGQFPIFNIGLHQTDPTTVGRRLVAFLETNDATKDEAMRKAKVLQGAIVAKDLDTHLLNQGFVLAKNANRVGQKSNLMPESNIPGLWEGLNKGKYFELTDEDSLRVLAHILIVVSTLDRLASPNRTKGLFKESGALSQNQAIQENILIGYVSYLRLANLEEMIPLYCSKLSPLRLHNTLSRNLIHLMGDDQRRQQIMIMRKLGLDVPEFAKRQPEIYLSDVNDNSSPGEVKGRFKILDSGPATLKYGRIVKPDFFGEDADHVDKEDEAIIRSLEWLLLVEDIFVETCAYVIRAYKYFLKNMKLGAARELSVRISGREIVLKKTPIPVRPTAEDATPGWFEEFMEGDFPEEFLQKCGTDKERLSNTVRNLWELECHIRALDAMETLSSLAGMARDGDSHPREMWQHASQEVRKVKACMEPVLKGWLLTVNEVDEDFQALREAYIPETVLAYVSSLHFAGTSLSRDSLLECMELASVIAEKGSDVAHEFLKSGRMKELVEAFASCSKALAIWTSDSKSKQNKNESKKIKDLGWSRELWSIKN
ncbi:107-domain-containing protein [Cercophora newfieldiana]|uniref:Nuclear pore complex protein n=1 Tax=Cercophora newfieldiana TaxID=92897 RepID=A0AA39YRJ5_9PEZI|nr:107-domain-containing protein [Cercophora newfieldiana]